VSLRIDTAEWIAGALVIGGTGLGVLGSDIPSTGTHGASYLYNDLVLPADAGKEIRGLIVTPPSVGTFYAYEDGSFTFAGAPGGIHSFVYRLFVDGVDSGTATGTISIGSSILAGAVVFDDLTVAGSFGGSPTFNPNDGRELSAAPRKLEISMGTISNPGFSKKAPAEIYHLRFNFAGLAQTPANPVVTVARHAGAQDNTPSAIISGSPTVSGSRVIQTVFGGVDGCDYALTCQADAEDGSRYVLCGVLPVRAP